MQNIITLKTVFAVKYAERQNTVTNPRAKVTVSYCIRPAWGHGVIVKRSDRVNL